MNATMSGTRLFALALSVALISPVTAEPIVQAKPASAVTVDIPYQAFTLPNGLRVLVHTDRKAPIVAVNLWYHVGSKDEPVGRTGFAHLFEHLMFNGSENAPGEYFTPFESVGATDMNGTTNSDRTNYFENVPTTALDMALWMESDRMGHLLGAIDQKTLDEQRGVVQNEKRQMENQPYGQLNEVVARTMFPVGHPYHHFAIGSMNDLNAASLDDVRTWFRTWYGPNNTVLVLAGDIDLATAREKATRYFGHIPATPTMTQPKVDLAVPSRNGRTEIEDKVSQVLLQRNWNVPQSGERDADLLDLTAYILAGSPSSRLAERLVHQDQLADSVNATNYGSQLAGSFFIRAMVRPGVDPARVEVIIEEELKRLLMDGPGADELARAKTSYRASFVRGIERIGGFGGKADVLASCATFAGDPACFRKSLDTIANATAAEVHAVSAKWLGNPSHTFLIKPGDRKPLDEEAPAVPALLRLPAVDARYSTSTSDVDRLQGVPQVGSFPPSNFPVLQYATLKNGSKLILAERHDTPIVHISYEFAGGYSSDYGGKLGTANFANQMLGEGAGDLSSLAFKARAEELGAELTAGATLDSSSASLSALTENLDASVQLFARMLREPRFDSAEIERVKGQWLSAIAQEKAFPQAAALRVLPPLLYGDAHPYGMPFTGSGTEVSVAAIGRQDLLNYQGKWLRPEQATVIVVGDATLEQMVTVLDRHFGSWKGEGAASTRMEVPQVTRPSAPRVFLIDKPGAVQANIYAGGLVPSVKDPGAVQMALSNNVLGGVFTARLNMNLREDKHWSYGAYTFLASALGQRPFVAIAPVQIDKVAESLTEMNREIGDYGSGKVPATPTEVAKVIDSDLRSQPGAFETAEGVLGTIRNMVHEDRPDNWLQVRNAQVAAFTPELAKVAAKNLDANGLTWVIVGDLSKIEAPVRALRLGEVTVIDTDGKPIAAMDK